MSLHRPQTTNTNTPDPYTAVYQTPADPQGPGATDRRKEESHQVTDVSTRIRAPGYGQTSSACAPPREEEHLFRHRPCERELQQHDDHDHRRAGEHHLLVVGRRRSEEHTSELQSLMRSSYAIFCLKKKKNTRNKITTNNK